MDDKQQKEQDQPRELLRRHGLLAKFGRADVKSSTLCNLMGNKKQKEQAKPRKLLRRHCLLVELDRIDVNLAQLDGWQTTVDVVVYGEEQVSGTTTWYSKD